MTSHLREKITQALIQATKDQDACRRNTLRLMSAAIKDRDVMARGKGKEAISDDEILALLVKMIKQREESSKVYEEAGRLELVHQERSEMDIIRSFLPPQFAEEEVRGACEAVVHELSAHGLRDMGKCINALKVRYPGQMDFCFASRVVRELLQ